MLMTEFPADRNKVACYGDMSRTEEKSLLLLRVLRHLWQKMYSEERLGEISLKSTNKPKCDI